MNTDLSVEQKGKSDTTRRVIRWLFRETTGVLGQAAVLFLSVGRWNWVMGWAFVIATTLWVGATALVVIPRNPELLAERLGPRKGAKTWDAVIMSIIGFALVACYILAGLDVRYEWTRGISPLLQVAALISVVLGYALTVWATAANAFFSLIVRIQQERGHTVAAGGPYRFVRHPAYAGGVALYLATPVMLGSLWALIPGGLTAVLMIVRTALEDKTLLNELDGYKEYAARVRYRLLPGIW
jgi:protein-S-isoprenylcysteine O-methyltransferase Ste14